MHYQSERFPCSSSDHIIPPPIMLTIVSRMVSVFRACHPISCSTHVFMVLVLMPTFNHIPFIYKVCIIVVFDIDMSSTLYQEISMHIMHIFSLPKGFKITHVSCRKCSRPIVARINPCTSTLLRAASHTRLRARDHYTSSTVIIGKDGAGPGLLHTTLEGPTEYVNARWMSSLHGFLHGIEWTMFYITWTIFKNHFLEVGLTQNPKIMAL